MLWTMWRREPFRIFFPLAILCGGVGVGQWLMYALGLSATATGAYHASVQAGGYMFCFMAGFLMTMLPRFSGTPPASHLELAVPLALMTALLLSLGTGRWVWADGCYAALVMTLAAFIIRRMAQRHRRPAQPAVQPPVEWLWLPVALACGLAGALCLMVGRTVAAPPLWVLRVGRPLASQGFLLGLVTGIGGFMAARLLGRATAARRPHSLEFHLAAAACFVASFWMEGSGAVGAAYLLRAAAVTAAFAWTARLSRRPGVPDAYATLLWVSLWMVVLGLWGAGLAPRYRVAMLHITLVGGLSLMTFAVGTMVVLTHAGQAARLQQPLWALRLVGWGLGGALTARLIAETQPAHYFVWLGMAATCWLIAGGGWLVFILPYVLQPPMPGAFEDAHETAKQRAAAC